MESLGVGFRSAECRPDKAVRKNGMGMASSQARLWSQAADPGHTRKAGAHHSSGRAHLQGQRAWVPSLTFVIRSWTSFSTSLQGSISA